MKKQTLILLLCIQVIFAPLQVKSASGIDFSALEKIGSNFVKYCDEYVENIDTDAELVFSVGMTTLSWLFEGCYKNQFMTSVEALTQETGQSQGQSIVDSLADLTEGYLSEITAAFNEANFLAASQTSFDFLSNYSDIALAIADEYEEYLNEANSLYDGSDSEVLIDNAIITMGSIHQNSFKDASFMLCVEIFGSNKDCDAINN